MQHEVMRHAGQYAVQKRNVQAKALHHMQQQNDQAMVAHQLQHNLEHKSDAGHEAQSAVALEVHKFLHAWPQEGS